jgi:hypothetical protein
MTTNPEPTNPEPSTPHIVECAYCVEGLRPFKVDPYMGPLYQGCIDCYGICRGCDGSAVFPAAPADLTDFIIGVNVQGWAPSFCPSCLGVTVLTEILPGDLQP